MIYICRVGAKSTRFIKPIPSLFGNFRLGKGSSGFNASCQRRVIALAPNYSGTLRRHFQILELLWLDGV